MIFSIDSRSTQSTKNPELPEAPPITIAVLINYDMADCVYCEILSEISHSTLLTIL